MKKITSLFFALLIVLTTSNVTEARRVRRDRFFEPATDTFVAATISGQPVFFYLLNGVNIIARTVSIDENGNADMTLVGNFAIQNPAGNDIPLDALQVFDGVMPNGDSMLVSQYVMQSPDNRRVQNDVFSVINLTVTTDESGAITEITGERGFNANMGQRRIIDRSDAVTL